MLHSPLTNPFPIPCSSSVVSEPSKSYQAAVPFLTKPLLAITGFANSNNLSQSTPVTFSIQTTPGFQNHQNTLNFSSVNNSSLSGSSSLSSSLVSLHSTSNGFPTTQHTSASPIPVYSNHTSSGSRDSRWLKLRVCTSVLGTSNSSQTNSNQSDNESKTGETKCSIKSEESNTSDASSSNLTHHEDEKSFHCAISGNTCQYAHPPATVRVDKGYVTVCYDFIKRRLCKFSYCKYYHPPPHQTEAIIKRGDEQRKLLESQQRLSELKTSNLISMQQPLQQTLPSTGLSALSSVAGAGGGGCPSTLRWPPSTTLLQPTALGGGPVYGTYLTPLNSLTDPNSFSASAILAAAAALQHNNLPGHGLLSTSSSLTGGSTYSHESMLSKSCKNGDTSTVFTSEPSVLSFNGCNAAAAAAITRLVNCLSNPQSSTGLCQSIQQQQPPPPPPQQQLHTAANLPTNWSLAASTSVTSIDNNNNNNTSNNNDHNNLSSMTIRSDAANGLPSNTDTPIVRAGMKREANIATGTFENSMDMHAWLPTKRANLSNSSSVDGIVQNKELTALCNGEEKLDNTSQTRDSKSHSSECGATFPTIFSCGSINPGFTSINSCTDIGGAPHVSAEVTNILNPLNMSIYGLPLSSQPTASMYTPSQFLYPPLYSMNGGCDASIPIASAAAALALNNFLVQQQQQQQVQSHQLLRSQLPATVTNHQISAPGLYSSYVPSTLATAATLAAGQQHPSAPDLHTNTSNIVFQQQQQQQALLLSLLLRSQQAQLAAAQVAAAGYLSQNDASRLPSIPTLQNPGCVLDSSCPLGSLTSGPYGINNFCSQNPMTNVAYINEKGHLLETLPICRDFKAGKCRRNSECRYVHLVDENVEVNQGRVIVCRDAAKGRCTRVPCKYYHIPLFAISANRSMALNSALANATGFSTV